MEFSFLLLERRQSETLDTLFGATLGTVWDAEQLMGGANKGPKEAKFTWSLRKKKPKVILPLTTALTQNPKFFEHLKKQASTAVNESRESPSIVNAPKWADKRKVEIVDLSFAPKEEFLKFASRFK